MSVPAPRLAATPPAAAPSGSWWARHQRQLAPWLFLAPALLVFVVYVIAPMASAPGVRIPGVGGFLENQLLRRPMSRILDDEVTEARLGGTRVVTILPGQHDLDGLCANFLNRSHRRAAFDAAMISAPATVARALETAGATT